MDELNSVRPYLGRELRAVVRRRYGRVHAIRVGLYATPPPLSPRLRIYPAPLAQLRVGVRPLLLNKMRGRVRVFLRAIGYSAVELLVDSVRTAVYHFAPLILPTELAPLPFWTAGSRHPNTVNQKPIGALALSH